MANKAEQARRHAIAAHAVLRWAEAEIKRDALRDNLEPGAFQVALDLSGLLDGRAKLPDVKICGVLTVAPDGTATPTASPNVAQVLAVCLARMPRAQADALRAELQAGDLPAAPPEGIKAARALLNRCRIQGDPQPRRGNVGFDAKGPG